MALERVGIPVAVGARGVLVAQVDIAIADDRLGGEQVVRLVAAELRVGEGGHAERRGVGREQDEPQSDRATHAQEASARGTSPARHQRGEWWGGERRLVFGHVRSIRPPCKGALSA